MTVTVAKTAGFCYGVKRAVELAQQAARDGKPCVMLGPIIHNAHVVDALAEQGIGCVSSPEEVPAGSRVIIRSHGESQAVYEQLNARGAEILDATCPNVRRIHDLVQQAEEQGRLPVIVGKRTHPEVVATAGWCRQALVVESGAELEQWLQNAPERKDLPLTLVSQTTSTKEIWDSALKKSKKECTNVEIFDTICNATYNRQREAKALSKQCEVMIVIGDPQSSNTRHLAELCRMCCDRVIWVESAEELSIQGLADVASVGITAGASTPGWIIKEVKNKMSEERFEIEESFAEMLEKSIKTLNTGDKVVGVVVNVTPTEIQVDLGTKHAGYIKQEEYSDDPSIKLEDVVHVGDEIETYVMRVNDQDGIVTLSKKRLDSVKNWENRARRRVVGSIRSVLNEERAAKSQEIWDNIEVDKHYKGVVKSLTSYGAFVDIGGVDGMVHISELSWSRIKHPSEVVSVGDEVDVYVIKYDPEKKKISLGMKDRSVSPWENFIEQYSVGDIASVKIVKLMSFGAFAEVVPGVDGLIHISQIADHRVEKPEDELEEGQIVDVKITDINQETQKVSLSRRAALREAAADDEEDYDEE